MFEVNQLGVISQDTSRLKEEIENSYRIALGDAINTKAETPQGQLILNDTALLAKAQANTLDLCNSFSIYTAVEQELDVAAGFFGYIRKTEVATVVQATLTGKAGTIIQQNSIVSDGTNNYTLQETVKIPASGSIEGTFQCTVAGAIPCLAGTLTEIVSTTVGWDSVNNKTNGLVGFARENDNIFRQRATANWLNIRAKGLMGSIIDTVAQLENVFSVVGNENYSNVYQTIDGILMKPNSIYLCVLGGKDEDIAKAIYDKKTNGTAVNGDTIVGYYDNNLKRLFNYLIFRPSFINLNLQVNYLANNYTTVDIKEKIKDTIRSYFADNPFMIGEDISGSLINKAFSDFNLANIISIKLSLNGDNWQDYITFNNLQVAVINDIVINQIQ